MSIKRDELQGFSVIAIQLQASIENEELVRKFLDGRPFEFANRAKVGDYIIKHNNNYIVMDEIDFNSLFELVKD